MLDKLVTAATDLPVILVILQGALGSALFALVLFLGQRFVPFVTNRIARSSRARRRAYLIEEQIKYTARKSKDFSARGALVALLIYRAMRPLFQALIWLTLGLVFGTVHGVLGVVGYLGCIYYLFSGLNIVTLPRSVADVDTKLEAIKSELDSLNET